MNQIKLAIDNYSANWQLFSKSVNTGCNNQFVLVAHYDVSITS